MLSPILHPASGTWMLGKIENHTAKLMSRAEIEAHISDYNRMLQSDASPVYLKVQNNMSHEEAEEILSKTVQELQQHFDIVLILTSWDVTKYANCGAGNIYACHGLAHQFLNEEKAVISAKHITKKTCSG